MGSPDAYNDSTGMTWRWVYSFLRGGHRNSPDEMIPELLSKTNRSFPVVGMARKEPFIVTPYLLSAL